MCLPQFQQHGKIQRSALLQRKRLGNVRAAFANNLQSPGFRCQPRFDQRFAAQGVGYRIAARDIEELISRSKHCANRLLGSCFSANRRCRDSRNPAHPNLQQLSPRRPFRHDSLQRSTVDVFFRLLLNYSVILYKDTQTGVHAHKRSLAAYRTIKQSTAAGQRQRALKTELRVSYAW